MPRTARLAAGALGVAAITAGAVAVGAWGQEEAPRPAAAAATATTEIRRQDLVETEEVDGTLGYSDARTVTNRLAGTVTRTPAIGSVVRTNHRLFEVDGEAAYLLDGPYPAYRALEPGLEGDDVRQLERNLRELDLDAGGDMRVDGSWDPGTTAAVRRWQQRKGLQADGSIEEGRVVFQPGARRIGTVAVDAGASTSAGATAGATEPVSPTALMTTTSAKRIVTVDLETTRTELAEPGAVVEVELPGGERATGTIARVGKVARQAASPEANNEEPSTIKLVIKLRRTAGTDLDQAPVDVRLEQRRARDVLSVPVTALLARAGGSFAVEVRRGSARQLVPVEPGLYTSGDVEIEGRGLEAGMTITNAEV